MIKMEKRFKSAGNGTSKLAAMQQALQQRYPHGSGGYSMSSVTTTTTSTLARYNLLQRLKNQVSPAPPPPPVHVSLSSSLCLPRESLALIGPELFIKMARNRLNVYFENAEDYYGEGMGEKTQEMVQFLHDTCGEFYYIEYDDDDECITFVMFENMAELTHFKLRFEGSTL